MIRFDEKGFRIEEETPEEFWPENSIFVALHLLEEHMEHHSPDAEVIQALINWTFDTSMFVLFDALDDVVYMLIAKFLF